ncbi:MAG: M48 family metalloprotease [Candidatus Saccharicenans sp.]
MREKLEAIRLPQEKELTESMSSLLNLRLIQDVIDLFPPKQSDREFYYFLKAHSLQIRNGLITRVDNVFNNVRTRLELKDEIELFVNPDRPLNASFYRRKGIFIPDILCIGNEFITRMNDAQIAFVIGHELGHKTFEHSEINEAINFLYSTESKIPPAIKKQYLFLKKLHEISADRVGLLASGDLEASVRALLLVISGLEDGLQELSLDDIFNYASSQLDELKNLNVHLEITHPAVPVRVQALRIFAESKLYRAFISGEALADDKELQSKMSELVRLIRAYPTNAEEYWTMMAEASALYMIAMADREMSFDERLAILNTISNFCWCPAEVLDEIQRKGPEDFLKLAIEYLKLNRTERMNDIIREMALFVIRDQRIDKAEYEKFLEIMQTYFESDQTRAITAIAAAINISNKLNMS